MGGACLSAWGNRLFKVRLKGPPGPGAVSGGISSGNGKISDRVERTLPLLTVCAF